jgi:hypothetical protein
MATDEELIRHLKELQRRDEAAKKI